MKYTNKSFTVGTTGSDAYREGWERTFGPKVDPQDIKRHAEGTCFSWCPFEHPMPGLSEWLPPDDASDP